MLDKLIDWIIQIWEQLIPFIIIMDYQEGVRFRLGKFRETLKAGFFWKIPFADTVIIANVAWEMLPLQPQSLTTKDGKSIVVTGLVKFKICDIKKHTINVAHSEAAIGDVTMGIISDEIMDRNWVEVKAGKRDNRILIKAKNEALEWGIEIQSVTLIDMAEITSIRLVGNKNNNNV